MPKPPMPDRTGLLILPAGLFLTALTFSVALVWDAWELAEGTFRRSGSGGVRTQLFADMLAALAGSLGLLPSIAVAVLMFAAASVWLGRSIATFRRRTAEDRRAVGLG